LQKGKTPCERQLPTAAFMRVLTYCVTAAPGAAQALRRGFAGHITNFHSTLARTWSYGHGPLNFQMQFQITRHRYIFVYL